MIVTTSRKKAEAEISFDERGAIIRMGAKKAEAEAIIGRKDGGTIQTPSPVGGGVERSMMVTAGGVSLAVLGMVVVEGTGALLLNG